MEYLWVVFLLTCDVNGLVLIFYGSDLLGNSMSGHFGMPVDGLWSQWIDPDFLGISTVGESSNAGGRPMLLFGRVEWSEILGLKTEYTYKSYINDVVRGILTSSIWSGLHWNTSSVLMVFYFIRSTVGRTTTDYLGYRLLGFYQRCGGALRL